MATLYVGDRDVEVYFETPSKAELSLYAPTGYKGFFCTVEHTKGKVTAQNLVDAALGLVTELVVYELSLEEQAAIVDEANALLGNDVYEEPTPRRKFMGIF